MSWILWTQVQNLQHTIDEYKAALHTARQDRNRQRKKAEDNDYYYCQAMMHYHAEKKVRIQAMEEIDKLVGSENNPLRAQAYDDPDVFRIPSGDRKGEALTKSDHIYLKEFRDVFAEKYSSKFRKRYKKSYTWVDFLNKKLSY
jgi:hypothetical protein